MLAQAIEAEADQWLADHAGVVDEQGHRQVVRNGRLPARSVLTGEVTQPRIRDKRPASEGREKFTSKILPPSLRKAQSVSDLIPWLYLRGISTGDMAQALTALLGPAALLAGSGLVASVVTGLWRSGEDDFRQWRKQSLEDKTYVYLWPDGMYFNIRLEDEGNDRPCILVLMGATTQGKKELIAMADGYRESEQSWSERLLEVESRGAERAPQTGGGGWSLGLLGGAGQGVPHRSPPAFPGGLGSQRRSKC